MVNICTCAAAAMTRSAAASAASSCGDSSAGTSTRSGMRLPMASSARSVVSTRISSALTRLADHGRELCRLAAIRFDGKDQRHI